MRTRRRSRFRSCHGRPTPGLPTLLATVALAASPGLLAAQQVPAQRSLQDLKRAFDAQLDRLYAGDNAPTREQEQDLRRRQADELAAFVQHEARGNDRWEGRLMLADMQGALRDRDAAVAALRGLDSDEAPPLMMLSAAAMAAAFDADDLRTSLIDRALTRSASQEERLQMAQVLMTRLRMVDRGEQIFAAALEAAETDEQRALVRWHHCEAIREREDLPENSYYQALDRLAEDLPNTYWGSVAKDRCTASQFTIGAEAIPFTVRTLDGATVESGSMRGKAVLLAFWSVTDPGASVLVQALTELQKTHGEELDILAVSVDPDAAEVAQRSQKLGAAFPLVCDGRGWQTDLALRYHVEAIPTLIAIDRRGSIAGLNLHVDTRAAREDLQAAVVRALQRD